MPRTPWGALLLCALSVTPLLAQRPAEVDQAEVLRLKDHVQYVDGSYQAHADDAYVQAMAPPDSDADKWFISVLTTKNCGGCARLKQDFATSPHLLALADPRQPQKSWAHYNVYASEDRSQTFRFAKLTITAYPTILVQPPRSGKYGDPSTVVYQGVYAGDPQRLATEIASAIKLYLAKRVSAQERSMEQAYAEPVGSDPPWTPPSQDPPYVGPFTPNNTPPAVPPLVDQRRPLFDFPWAAVLTLLLSGFSLPAIVALVVWVIYFIREKRKAAGQPLLLTDEQLAKLIEILNRLGNEKQSDTSGK